MKKKNTRAEVGIIRDLVTRELGAQNRNILVHRRALQWWTRLLLSFPPAIFGFAIGWIPFQQPPLALSGWTALIAPVSMAILFVSGWDASSAWGFTARMRYQLRVREKGLRLTIKGQPSILNRGKWSDKGHSLEEAIDAWGAATVLRMVRRAIRAERSGAAAKAQARLQRERAHRQGGWRHAISQWKLRWVKRVSIGKAKLRDKRLETLERLANEPVDQPVVPREAHEGSGQLSLSEPGQGGGELALAYDLTGALSTKVAPY